MAANYGAPPVLRSHARWGMMAGNNGPPDASSVYFPDAPMPSTGTAGFQNKVLPTIRVGVAATHPQTIATGAGFPDVFRFSARNR
jgi:hypothetical protein